MNPFLSVWLRPRETIRYIVATNPELHLGWLAAASGVVRALDRASEKNLGDNYSLLMILFLVFIVGPAAGILMVYFWAWLVRVSGGWLGGAGDSASLRAAVAWASVPQTSTLVLWIPMALILGADLFKEETNRLDDQLFLSVLLLGIAGLMIISGVWSFVLLCKMVSEVQAFQSAWKGLLNIILAAVLMLTPLLAVVFSFLWLSSYR